ncbi:MAG: TetR/AcrR family transcriptional regulator [Spirochaetes bacterium]|nr:TetR/AcrR family transcriptional regulator [Spirochaetota bacterium]
MENKNYTRVPKQERSRETKQSILKAGLELFSEKSYYKTNSKEISKRAGVSIGSFYMYFPDKKELFKELLIEYHKQIRAVLENIEIESYVNSGKRRDFLNYLINKLIEAHYIYPEFHQEINVMALTDSDFIKVNEKSKAESIEVTKTLLHIWKDQLRIKDIEAAAIVVQTSIEEIVHVLIFSKHKAKNKKIIDECTDMLSRYLFED